VGQQLTNEVGLRYPALDVLRGFAVVWMTVFHFSFDLNHFGWIHQDFYRDPLWTVQRTCILSLFLFCAGFGQFMAFSKGQDWRHFWRRWSQVAGCAVLVSVGSWFMFPGSWIYFGVLHGIAAMLLVARLSAAWGGWLWLAGAVTVMVWWNVAFLHSQFGFMSIFNSSALSWVGLALSKPITEDYVPVFPWMAAVWWGQATGARWNQRSRRQSSDADTGHPRNAAYSALNWLGRNSLSWYMLHQPVMLGALVAVSKF
jgi:uncharacterized membrane protein